MLDVIAAVTLIFLALIFKKSKLICIVFFVFIYTLAGWNTFNGDYESYKRIYSLSLMSSDLQVEVGYIYLNKISVFLGLSYQDFLKVLFIPILSLACYLTLKYSKYPALFSALYLVIFILEFVYVRNYISHSLFLFSLLLLFKESKFNKFWFFLLIILALTIHATSIIWFIFIFIFAKDQKILSYKKIIIYVCLSVFFSALLLRPFLAILGGHYAYKVYFYLQNVGITTVFFVHPLIVFLVYYFFKMAINSGKIPSNNHRLYIIVINLNLISLFYLALYYHIPYFARFLRVMFTVDLIFMLNALYYVKNKKRKVNMFIIFIFVTLALIMSLVRSTQSLTIYPLFKKNILWGEEDYDPNLIQDYTKSQEESENSF